MIRLIFCALCWIFCSIPAAVIGFPALYLTGRVDLLWKLSLWAANAGYRLAGIRMRSVGREKFEAGRAYLFMSNHASNLDPPIITCLLGRRIAIIAKQELFKIPLFGRAMRAAQLRCRQSRRRQSPRSRVFARRFACCNRGWECWYFPRERAHLMESCCRSRTALSISRWKPAFPSFPSPSWAAMRRGRRDRMSLHAGEVVVYFHAPIDPHQFARKEDLLAAVRAAINSALPEPYRDSPTVEPASH